MIHFPFVFNSVLSYYESVLDLNSVRAIRNKHFCWCKNVCRYFFSYTWCALSNKICYILFKNTKRKKMHDITNILFWTHFFYALNTLVVLSESIYPHMHTYLRQTCILKYYKTCITHAPKNAFRISTKAVYFILIIISLEACLTS